MNKTFLSIVIAVAVIAVIMVSFATHESTALVLRTTDLNQAKAAAHELNRIRVGGRVADMPIEYSTQPAIKLKFFIQDPTLGGEPIAVEYEGLKPDMFAAGRDVIIDGSFSGGTLYASQLLTQCPSKYEPPKPQ